MEQIAEPPQVDEPAVEEEDSIPLVYEEIRRSIELQRQALDSLQTKAATLLGFAGAILALLFGNLKDETLQIPVQVSVFTAVGLSLLAIILASLVFWSRRIRTDPSPQTLLEKFYDKDLTQTRLQVAVNRVDAFKQNHALIEQMAVVLRIAMLAQTGCVLALGIAIALLILAS